MNPDASINPRGCRPWPGILERPRSPTVSKPRPPADQARDMKGYRLAENHEGKLSLTVRMEVRVGEFADAAGCTESGGG